MLSEINMYYNNNSLPYLDPELIHRGAHAPSDADRDAQQRHTASLGEDRERLGPRRTRHCVDCAGERPESAPSVSGGAAQVAGGDG